MRVAAALAAIFPLIASCGLAQARSEWVHPGPDGRLVYKSDPLGNRVPDFSNVGYHGGDSPLPDLPVKAEVSPAEGDAGARIQAAIDQVSQLPADAHGWRGAVLIRKGRYDIKGSVYIRTGGVVLRGEGYGKDGTLLYATGSRQRSLIIISPEKSAAHGHASEDEGAESGPQSNPASGVSISDPYLPVGARSFHVANATGLEVGEAVVVHRPSTREWIHRLGMDRIPQNRDGTVVQWRPGTKDLYFSRVITAIKGDEVTVDAPIVCALDRTFGGGELRPETDVRSVTEVGVENMGGDSEYHGSTDEKHGWVFIDMLDARNAWVRQVQSVHFGYSCVFVQKACKWVTVDHCICLDPISVITGGRRYSFAVDGQLTLVEHCLSRNGRHDFVMHALAAGPDVFFDCAAILSHADSGPHHRWSVGVLYDNVRVSPAPDDRKSGGQINIRDRGSMGTGHGWAGADQVAWNCKAAGMIVEQPPTAQNWAIGCMTPSRSGDGYWDSFGKPVAPQSLYLAQLAERHAGSGVGVGGIP